MKHQGVLKIEIEIENWPYDFISFFLFETKKTSSRKIKKIK